MDSKNFTQMKFYVTNKTAEEFRILLGIHGMYRNQSAVVEKLLRDFLNKKPNPQVMSRLKNEVTTPCLRT